MSPRQIFYALSAAALVVFGGLTWWSPYHAAFSVALGAVVVIVVLGVYDVLQHAHTIRRNFPFIGRFRYLAESIRPELQQYFVESNESGRPFSRDLRSLAYERAKNINDTIAFGTEKDVYALGYEWINHSLMAKHPHDLTPRVRIGGPDCQKPYDAALLNVSAMSYGALSTNAIRALNRGAKIGGFAHNTGEGGLSPYHLKEGGDLVWQIGTGYFGCRDGNGNFNAKLFAEKATIENVKMVEIKLSQGAKPGHGGILPASKVDKEIAEIRNVPLGKDVISPPAHTAFSTPLELCAFIKQLRDLSRGKPIGFKLCVGKRREFLAICKAMVATSITPDFITVDGGEGGTGAAPLEFSNVVGTPLIEGLVFVHNALVGVNLRDRIKVIASGRIVTGFDIAQKLAIGADLCNSARAMMFALGCIQAQRCNTNTCPTGIATQDRHLVAGLVVDDKAVRVAHFQQNTVRAFAELLAAAGLSKPNQLRPWHILRRVSRQETKHYGEMFEYVKRGALLGDDVPESYARAWFAAQAKNFESATNDPPSIHPA